MTLSVNTVLEVRTDGDDTNGGGFVSGASGVDRSQQAAAHATLTTAATVHTTTSQINVPAGEHAVHANDVGNLFQINSGTATAGVYEITAVDAVNNRWTLDRSAGTAGQTCAGKMGGAFASIGKAAQARSSWGQTGMRCWVKSGTYTLTSSSSNVSGGKVATLLWIAGYHTTRGDLNGDIGSANRPVIDVGVLTSITVFDGAPTNLWCVSNIVVDGNGNSSVLAFNGVHITNCKALACTTGVGPLYSSAPPIFCQFESCTVGLGGNASPAVFCHFKDCGSATQYGFTIYCVFDNSPITNPGSYNNQTHINPIIYNASGSGIQDLGTNSRIVNPLLVDNGGYGITYQGQAALNTALLINHAFFNNTSGELNATVASAQQSGKMTLTADPFVDAANGDFNINNTAGGGAVLRAVEITL